MVILVVGMLVCVAIALVVVGLVAVPARREGREVLTSRGEDLVAVVRDRTTAAVETARDKISSASTNDGD